MTVIKHPSTRVSTSTGPEMETVDLSTAETESEPEARTCVGDPVSPLTDGKTRNIPRVNYLHVSKQGLRVEGGYILDLSLPPPPQLAPGIAAVQAEKNLSLFTTSGPIDTEIWTIHDGSGKSKRVLMDLCTKNGSVRTKVHDPSSPEGNAHARPAFDIDLRAYYGGVSVSLPHCFRGPITIRTDDERIAFSPAFEQSMALVSDVPGIRVYFVGERPFSGKWGLNRDIQDVKNRTPDEEPIDELTISGRFVSVRINWDDEPELPEMQPSGWQNFCGGAERFFTSGRVC